MKIIAIKDMSAGNETVGEAWKETKIFDDYQPISDIIKWANPDSLIYGYAMRKNVILTVPEDTPTTPADEQDLPF